MLELDLTDSHLLTTYAGLLLRNLLDHFARTLVEEWFENRDFRFSSAGTWQDTKPCMRRR